MGQSHGEVRFLVPRVRLIITESVSSLKRKPNRLPCNQILGLNGVQQTFACGGDVWKDRDRLRLVHLVNGDRFAIVKGANWNNLLRPQIQIINFATKKQKAETKFV